MSATSLELAKQFLRVGGCSMDALIQAELDGVEEWVQQYCGISLGEGIFTDALDGGTRALWPRNRPLRGFLTIINRDAPDVAVVPGIDYFVVDNRGVKYSGTYGWMYGGVGGGVYGAWTGRMQAITERWMEGQGRWLVTYQGGFYVPALTTAGPDDGGPHYPVPGGLTRAILHLLRRDYDNRGGVKAEAAAGWKVNWADLASSDIFDMLAPYRGMDV